MTVALLLLACVEEDPACQETQALEAIGYDCAPLWTCCVGDPARDDVSCWYQSADPEQGEPPLVWECAGSLTNCESAPVDASEWACSG